MSRRDHRRIRYMGGPRNGTIGILHDQITRLLVHETITPGPLAGPVPTAQVPRLTGTYIRKTWAWQTYYGNWLTTPVLHWEPTT